MREHSIVPFADYRPSPNFGFYDAANRLIRLTPRAIVPHSADSQLNADPPRTFFAPGGQSTHFWIRGDGHLIQMVPLDVPAWGNGVLDRADGVDSPNPYVREWYRTRRNPNLDTISVEFAGFGLSRGDRFTPVTEAQLQTWARLIDFLLAEGWLADFNGFNCILHREISATACPDGRFTGAGMVEAYTARRKDDMTPEEREILYALVDLLIGRSDGQPYGSLAERLNAVRAAVADQQRFQLGLGLLQQRVAELERRRPGARLGEIAAALEQLAAALRGADGAGS